MLDIRFAKSVVFINSLLPGVLLSLDWYYSPDQLGTNPPFTVIHTTGMLALIFLMLTLTVTPLRKITGWNFLSHFRRMLGLFAFFYASIHFISYLDLNWNWSISGMIQWDILARKKTFILFGVAALSLMAPLALTSFNGIIKRMGGRNWKRLHSLIYPIAILAVIHFCMFGKIISRLQLMFIVVLGALLAYRVVAKYVPAVRYRRPAVVPRAAVLKSSAP